MNKRSLLNPFGLAGDDLKKWNVFLAFVFFAFSFACCMIVVAAGVAKQILQFFGIG